jgi:hypothetical protein
MNTPRATHLDLDLGLGAVSGDVHRGTNLEGPNDTVKALRHWRVVCVERCERECCVPAHINVPMSKPLRLSAAHKKENQQDLHITHASLELKFQNIVIQALVCNCASLIHTESLLAQMSVTSLTGSNDISRGGRRF